MKINRVGILTSGGDAPGMNAVIYSVVKYGIKNNLEIVGIYRGFNGLIRGDVKLLKLEDVTDIIQRGGTILFSARCKEFKKGHGLKMAIQTCRENNIDAIIVVGGDGSFKGAYNLYKEGIGCIGIPGTIDNDISCTDYSIGYDTAVNTAVSMVDRLCDTTASHDRCSVVEVMGRNSGYIALDVGVSCGANYIVVPEFPFDKNDLFKKIKDSMALGKKHFIVVVAEKILDVSNLAKEIENETGVESRATVLGHVQRGGNPTIKDRVYGTSFGVRALDLLLAGKSGKVVGLKNDEVIDCDIPQGLEMNKSFPKDLYEIANKLY